MAAGRIRSRARERARRVQLRGPRWLRPWVRREPGSERWWRRVQRLGVSRAAVEGTLALAAAGGPPSGIDPHALRPGPSDAERVVSYVLLAHHVRSHDALLYVGHHWWRFGRALKEWVVAAYAQMIDGDDDALRHAALYSLRVDFFEAPERAAFVFPRLLWQARCRGALLEASGPVPWELKRAAYRRAAEDPALHDALARALAASFLGETGSVEPVEARALFRSIVVRDPAVAQALESILTTPIRWRLVGVLRVDEQDERWRKWLPQDAAPSFLVLLSPHAAPRWVPGSALLHDGRRIGRLVRGSFPFDGAIPHERELVEHAGTKPVLFRIEGDVARARAALGADVDAWPPGLAPDDAGRPTPPP